MRIVRIGVQVVLCLVAAGAFVALYNTGTIGVSLTFLLAGAATWTVLGLGIGWLWRRRVRRPGPSPHPHRPSGSSAWLRVQPVLRAAAWAAVCWGAQTALPRFQLSSGDFVTASTVIWVAGAVLIVRGVVTRRRLWPLVTVALVALGGFVTYQLGSLYRLEADPVVLGCPVTGRWVVAAGGDSVLVSHHHPLVQQRFAVDLVIPADHPPPLPGVREKPEASPAYGRAVLSPVEGVVHIAEDGLPDAGTGEPDTDHPAGNHVSIQSGPERFVLLAHLAPGSVQVREGEAVRAGQPVARVGNSGNSAEPHLHIQVQSGPTLYGDRPRTWADVRTYPLAFDTTGGSRGAVRVNEPRTSEAIVFDCDGTAAS
jgi:hypothetical protein